MSPLQVEALRATERAITSAICAASHHARHDEWGCWAGLREVDWVLGLIARGVDPQPKRKHCPGLKAYRHAQERMQAALLFIDVVDKPDQWRTWVALLPERCPGQ